MLKFQKWKLHNFSISKAINLEFTKFTILIFTIFAGFINSLLADLEQWKDYSWKEIPYTRMGGYQDIIYNKSTVGFTEFLIVTASNGNPKGEPQKKKTEVRGGSWEQIVYAGNDDKSLEVWLRFVTKNNKSSLGEINTKNAAAKVSILTYRGNANSGKVVEKTLHNESVAINGSGSGSSPYLVIAASDNGGSSDIAQVDYGNTDDRTWIYLTKDRTFKDSTAGKRRGAIAMIELKENKTTPSNQAPIFTKESYSLKDAYMDEYYTEHIYHHASDPDGTSLTFSKVSGPGWAKVSEDGWIEGTPPSATNNPHKLIVKVTDFDGLTAQSTFYIQVKPIINAPPSFTNKVFKKPDALSYVDYKEPIHGQVTDEESSTLTFSILNGPKWLSVTISGIIQGTPTPDDLGLNLWTIRVTDNLGLSDEATMQITVDESNISKYYPTAINSFEGELINGSIDKLQHNDGKYQVIREIEDGSSRSKMFYFWEFDVQPAKSTTLEIKAHRTDNHEGDDFKVAYSINGSPYKEAFIITKITEENSQQTFRLPADTSGLVSIRISDTNRTKGNNKLDKIFIDSMVITCENDEATNENPSIKQAYPIAEESKEGDIINGTLTKLQSNDGRYQVIREVEDKNSRSKMFYFWEFDVLSTKSNTLEIKAHRTENDEGDDFKVMYSTTGLQYNLACIISNTDENAPTQSIQLPDGISGKVSIRISDTDRTKGNDKLDKIYIDSMVITSN